MNSSSEYNLSGSNLLQQRFQASFDRADVRFNGHRDWDIQVHDPSMFSRTLRYGSLGFAEAYMDGCWDCPRLDEMFTRLLRARLNRNLIGIARLKAVVRAYWHVLINLQRPSRAFHVGEAHYDIGNDLYRRMLDPTMSYSCGYWAAADDLATAQQHKLELICRKLELKPGMTLLDIGCGWGGLAEYAARHYGVLVTGITISREQQKLAEERVAGLPVEIQLKDYRDLEGKFDRIVSVGMFEHVGHKIFAVIFRPSDEY
jgi:cyclopropane-fatty-acyl-phospholipid synthase